MKTYRFSMVCTMCGSTAHIELRRAHRNVTPIFCCQDCNANRGIDVGCKVVAVSEIEEKANG